MNRACCLAGLLVLLVTTALGAQHQRQDRYGDPLPDGALARLGTIRLRPGAAPTHLAFTPDSKQIICCAAGYGSGNALTYYDVTTGKELRRVELLDSRALAFTVLANGRGLALIRLVPGKHEFYLW